MSAIKQIYFNKTGKSFKATYLSDRRVYFQKQNPDPFLNDIDKNFYTFYKSISSQVVNDFREVYVTFSDRAIFCFSKGCRSFYCEKFAAILIARQLLFQVM